MASYDTRTGTGAAEIFDGLLDGTDLGVGVSFIFENSADDGSGPALHLHHYDEIFIIRGGRARFFVGQDVVVGEAGMVLVAPAETPHRFEVIGPDRYLATHVHVTDRIETVWL